MKNLILKAASLVVLISLPAIVMSQQDRNYFHDEIYFVDSGLHDGSPNSENDYALAFSEVIQVIGAPWLQLHFASYNLMEQIPPDTDRYDSTFVKIGETDLASYIIITSLKDGDQQRLDANSLPLWHSSSGYFNGDAVEIELHVAGEAIRPGTVVSIDPIRPGQLQVSESAYDHKVAGIISGANGVATGIMMQSDELSQATSQQHPVALTGRVYAWADASTGSIQPGDLLTTSQTPGHAMKVSDHSQGQGAIIGKAMSILEEGQGLVLVLVALQ